MTENGAPVHGLRVAPVGASRRAKLGVVMAIDASGSMRASLRRRDRCGAGLRRLSATRSATRAYTSDRARGSCSPSRPRGQIGAALENPGRRRGDRHVRRDAAGGPAHRSLRPQGGYVVVLSDGTDHGRRPSDEVISAAGDAANVRVYRSACVRRRFRPDALGRLPRNRWRQLLGGGSADELRRFTGRSALELSNAHVVSYRSTARAGA